MSLVARAAWNAGLVFLHCVDQFEKEDWSSVFVPVVDPIGPCLKEGPIFLLLPFRLVLRSGAHFLLLPLCIGLKSGFLVFVLAGTA